MLTLLRSMSSWGKGTTDGTARGGSSYFVRRFDKSGIDGWKESYRNRNLEICTAPTKGQARQSGLKSGVVVDPGLKTGARGS